VEIEVFRTALIDIASLRPDDVLAGEVSLDAPLTVKLNGLVKYEAGAMQLDGERAVRLSRLIARRAN
jgi:hypothetical protein